MIGMIGSPKIVRNRFLSWEGRSRNLWALDGRVEPRKVAAHSAGSLSVPMNPMRRFFGTASGERMIAHAGPTLARMPNHGF
jgi:hypothetical protein